jgi:hypothetical protein
MTVITQRIRDPLITVHGILDPWCQQYNYYDHLISCFLLWCLFNSHGPKTLWLLLTPSQGIIIILVRSITIINSSEAAVEIAITIGILASSHYLVLLCYDERRAVDETAMQPAGFVVVVATISSNILLLMIMITPKVGFLIVNKQHYTFFVISNC